VDRADLAELAAMTRDTGIVVVADEVYEHIVFDGVRHESVPFPSWPPAA
jgi:methionine aminotransferase